MFRKVENFVRGRWQALTGSELMRNSDLLNSPPALNAFRGSEVLIREYRSCAKEQKIISWPRHAREYHERIILRHK
jgi:hypothetical protein